MTIDLAEHTRRVRAELERDRPTSPRWRAARDLACAAIDLDLRCTFPASDNADRPNQSEHR